LLEQGLRLPGPHSPTVAQGVEPESIAISPDSRTAYLSLTSANAIAEIDLERRAVTDIIGLGTKDHSLLDAAGEPVNGFDASDTDGGIEIRAWPVRSFFQPDGLAVIEEAGERFIVTANEGDPIDKDWFSEQARVAQLPLDERAFANGDALKRPEALGRLHVTTEHGDIDDDGRYEELYMLGARSFSVWTTQGRQVFDSGDDFERITSIAAPPLFNAEERTNVADRRSDDRGPEPEHLVVGKINGRSYVFVVFERIGGVIVYDITDPRQPFFVQYINNRNPDGKLVANTDGASMGDLEPEGLILIAPAESPTGEALLVVSHELSRSTTLFRIRPRSLSAGR
jgi:hypothetical protein